MPTGNFMPAEKAQIRLMTANPITLHTCIPAPDQVTPERAYFKDLDFYKKTLFHTPFLSRGRAVTLLEYRDAKIVFEVDEWFSQLPQGVQRYLLPLQSMYAKWYSDHVRDLTQNYSYCPAVQNQTDESSTTSYETSRSLEDHLVLPITWMSVFLVLKRWTSEASHEPTTCARHRTQLRTQNS